MADHCIQMHSYLLPKCKFGHISITVKSNITWLHAVAHTWDNLQNENLTMHWVHTTGHQQRSLRLVVVCCFMTLVLNKDIIPSWITIPLYHRNKSPDQTLYNHLEWTVRLVTASTHFIFPQGFLWAYMVQHVMILYWTKQFEIVHEVTGQCYNSLSISSTVSVIGSIWCIFA